MTSCVVPSKRNSFNVVRVVWEGQARAGLSQMFGVVSSRLLALDVRGLTLR